VDREKILQRFEHELERMVAATILDRAFRVAKTSSKQATDFLDPYQQRTAEQVLRLLEELKFISWGGYAQAERVRLLLFPADRRAATADVPLAFVEVDTGQDEGELTHRDYLGAVLALGLRREKIGDIILTGEGLAQLVVSPEILSYLLANLTQVGRFPVRLREVGAEDLRPPALRCREIRTTVASLRLDAVASAGFGLSRSKLAPAIRAGQAKLNWQSVKNPGSAVKEGDVISLAGRGRVEIAQVLGESRKGRIQVLLKKHL
jgi:RNA-binding protein YlmH